VSRQNEQQSRSHNLLFLGLAMLLIRKQPVGPLNEWNLALKPGQRCWLFDYSEGITMMYDLRESTGKNKSDDGDLTPHVVKKHGRPRHAILADDGLWYWEE